VRLSKYMDVSFSQMVPPDQPELGRMLVNNPQISVYGRQRIWLAVGAITSRHGLAGLSS